MSQWVSLDQAMFVWVCLRKKVVTPLKGTTRRAYLQGFFFTFLGLIYALLKVTWLNIRVSWVVNFLFAGFKFQTKLLSALISKTCPKEIFVVCEWTGSGKQFGRFEIQSNSPLSRRNLFKTNLYANALVLWVCDNENNFIDIFWYLSFDALFRKWHESSSMLLDIS